MRKTTVEFNQEAAEELEHLANRLSTTKAEVLRSALSLYAFVAEELGQGGRDLGIVEKESNVKKIVVVPGLRTRRKQPEPARKHVERTVVPRQSLVPK